MTLKLIAMKALKIFYFVFLAIFTGGCEKESLHSTEENAPETMYLQLSSNSETEIIVNDALPTLKGTESYNLTIKSSDNGSDYRLYNSLEELKNDCSEFKSASDLAATGAIGYTSFSAYYFGVYLEVVEGGDLIDIVIKNTSSEIIYQDRRLISDPVFFGIATEEPMDNISFSKVNFDPYGDVITSTNAHIGYCDFIIVSDTDGDGVPDDEDLVPNSNTEETVVIEDCDSSVENITLGEGYMLSDKIDDLEVGEYKNHGQFVRAIAHYLTSLVEEGIIIYEEKDFIMACAGSSSIMK